MHMATHALALLIAALAYTFARRHAADPRFAFGTGKLGDLAGFTSAIILTCISALIGYESISRLISPVPIHFDEAIPIAVVGLGVNIATAWLLGGDHDHGHGHGHGHGGGDGHDDVKEVALGAGRLLLEVYEDGVPPRFRLRAEGLALGQATVTVTTTRPGGASQVFSLVDKGAFLESAEEIPEPHEFTAGLHVARAEGDLRHAFAFAEHHHHAGAAHDHNLRAAFVHVLADAVVSVLAIGGLLLGRFYGWVWMDPATGIIGSLVIANWAMGLVRDTAQTLLDITPDAGMAEAMRKIIEVDGDKLVDLHLWRLGPGHLGAIASVTTATTRGPAFYRARLERFEQLSHVTVEVHHQGPVAAAG
jgi:cation diffusion facilitator family transporter